MSDVHITFRATDRTPVSLRYLDGGIYPVPPDQVCLPGPGFRGWVADVPGVMRSGHVWEIEDLPVSPDPGPVWAQALSRKLDEIKALLERVGHDR